MISQQDIDERQLVERYLAGKLSDAERAEFESYFLEHPEVVQQLEVAARIKGGLSALQRAGEMPELFGKPSVPPAKAPRRWYLGIGIAASVLVAFTVMSNWPRQRPAPLTLAGTPAAFADAAGALLPVLDSYEVLRVRGETYDAVIELPAKPGVIEVRVAPEFSAPEYRVQLTADIAGEQPPLAALDGLAAGSDGSLLLYLSPARLQPGPYRLSIEPAARGGPNSTFRLNVLSRELPARAPF